MNRRAFCYWVVAMPALALCGRPPVLRLSTVRRLTWSVSISHSDVERYLKGIEKSFERTGERLQTAGANMTKAITLPLARDEQRASENGRALVAASAH